MIAKLFSPPHPLSPRRQHFREKYLGALFIIQKCPSKPVHPPPFQPFDASYAPETMFEICTYSQFILSYCLYYALLASYPQFL